MPANKQLTLAEYYKDIWDKQLAKQPEPLQARIKASQANKEDYKDREVVAFTQLVAEEAERLYDESVSKVKKEPKKLIDKKTIPVQG